MWVRQLPLHLWILDAALLQREAIFLFNGDLLFDLI